MKRALARVVILFCLAASVAAEHRRPAQADAPTKPPIARTDAEARLRIPPRWHAVVGQDLRIYYESLWATPDRSRRKVVIANLDLRKEKNAQSSFGEAKDQYWMISPLPDQVGTHKLFVAAAAADGTLDEIEETELCVAPADAGAGREIALLIVGDSLTNATMYPNEWARLLNQPGNPKWTMLGTHKPSSAAEGVAHEGYGGWRWQTFLDRYEPKPDPAKRIRSSPFVYLGTDGKPAIDLPRYLREACGGRKPDVVTFLLGINDCFGAPANDPAALDQHIDGVFAHADKLLAEFRKAAPEAKLAVCLTPPPNSRPEAFVANYKDRYPRDGWLKIQTRLVERQLEHFGGREKENIYVVPTNLDLDIVDGYPPDNAVHPNKEGYARIAASLHAWLKWQLYEDSLTKK